MSDLPLNKNIFAQTESGQMINCGKALFIIIYDENQEDVMYKITNNAGKICLEPITPEGS